MSLFLSALPVWAAMLLIVIFPTAVAVLGLLSLRRRIGFEHLASNNEIAGFKFATVGVIYSVLVAFAVIIVWQKFNDAENAVVQEAGASATIYRLAAGQQPSLVATRTALTNYLKLAIHQDWPAMAKQTGSSEANRALNLLYATVLQLEKDGPGESVAFAEMLKQLDLITQGRRARLHLASGVVPAVVWLVLSCGAILTVGFTFFFGTKNLRAQTIMVGILSFLVFLALFSIVSIDHPFTGPSFVGSEPLQAVIDDFARTRAD